MMATQVVEAGYTTGQTLTFKLFALGSDVIAGSASATEHTNAKSIYYATFTDIPTATYRLVIFRGSVAVANGYVDIQAGAGVYRAYLAKSETVCVTPLQLSSDLRGAPSNIELKQGEVRTIGPLAITDGNGDDLDVSGKILRVVIEERDGTNIQVIEDANITVSGSNNSQISFDSDENTSARIGTLKWALWDTTNEDVDAGIEGLWLGGGQVIVDSAPRKQT